MDRFPDELRRLRARRGLSLRELAAAVHYGKSYLHELETGRKPPSPAVASRLDDALHANGVLAAMLGPPAPADSEGEIEALELARRVTASDVSAETLDRLERAVDAMAMAYATTPPANLVPRVRRHLEYASRLVDARKTLVQHRRLLAVGGWLSLLRATLHIDLRQAAAADAYLSIAAEFAGQAEHREIAAWCLETKAWAVLTAGDYRQALDLSRQAQGVAPRDGSAFVQATAQEGRAWARLGNRAATRRTLDRVERLADHRPFPEHPEHHYQYDPAKAHAYTATTLAWAGDPAAEAVAREVIAELEQEGARPRRVASAQLDLGLALLAAEKPDEAAAAATAAIGSGRIVPSNWWRASEVVAGVQRAGVEAHDLREQYEAFRPSEPE
ncbi:helix-turn-helix domain-containing protein [Couchioplanes caeruleus]|uniref:Transcriptional regulator n=2 Tax=Couchioplanes caeruleus TaxID=56438 RepID=A0A1K0FLF9_9ACTN|nr:helix-turn-helix domain-containing protein [Couchioplanes caeruleus]OJF13568.1 transcriptional regulator [Couchioplanes caeruleus subsp. caeruleus]ROP30109.1 helix-turn-helix protein [Couchioplanes caeruleus]